MTEVLQAQNEESKHRESEFETTLHQRWQNVEDRIHMRESNVDQQAAQEDLQVVQRRDM